MQTIQQTSFFTAMAQEIRAARNQSGESTPGSLGPKATCPICEDLGVVYDHSSRRGDPGGYVLCRCQRKICRCTEHLPDPEQATAKPPYEFYDQASRALHPCPARRAHIALEKLPIIERRSGIPGRYNGRFLDDIRYEEEHLSLTVAASSAHQIIVAYAAGAFSRGLYLHGGTGSGKTLLSCALLNELMRFYQLPVRYAKISRDILGKLRASFNPNGESYGEGRRIEQELATVPALVIDDFGVHRETDWVNQVLYDLIDARYENNLLTIITSNERMESWKEISGGRIYSRLREMCEEHHIDAPDFRLQAGESLPGRP